MPNQSTENAGLPGTSGEPRGVGNGGAAVLVFVAGMGAGVVLGLMLAPSSGASLRRGVGRRLRESADWVKAKTTGVKQEVLVHADGLRDGIKAAAAAAVK
jgi:gas vesicle protein